MAVYHNPNDLRHDDANVRDAVRFGLVVAVLGVAFLVVAAVWVSTCDGATADTFAGPGIRDVAQLRGRPSR